METNLPVMSKRVWTIARVVFFMLPKGFTKPKLLMDLNLMLKRPGKLAGKAIANFISHHHHHSRQATSAASHDPSLTTAAGEYEFSCSNTPSHSFFPKSHAPRHFFGCAHAPLTLDDDEAADGNALKVAWEMMGDRKGKSVVVASPALPPSGRTWRVRQVRVTDSPFPVLDDGDHQVDKDADEYIKMFYDQLRNQG